MKKTHSLILLIRKALPLLKQSFPTIRVGQWVRTSLHPSFVTNSFVRKLWQVIFSYRFQSWLYVSSVRCKGSQLNNLFKSLYVHFKRVYFFRISIKLLPRFRNDIPKYYIYIQSIFGNVCMSVFFLEYRFYWHNLFETNL